MAQIWNQERFLGRGDEFRAEAPAGARDSSTREERPRRAAFDLHRDHVMIKSGPSNTSGLAGARLVTSIDRPMSMRAAKAHRQTSIHCPASGSWLLSPENDHLPITAKANRPGEIGPVEAAGAARWQRQ
jgi:hypothetical protein